jgi:hypothetical protein
MLFTKKKGFGLIFRTVSSFKDQLPKDWAKAAEKELKGTPLEQLIWHTPEVITDSWLVLVLIS